jgi:hypothetical protein
MEPEVPSLCSQDPVTYLYPEPDESLPNPPILFLFKNHFNIILTKTLRCSKWPLSFRCTPLHVYDISRLKVKCIMVSVLRQSRHQYLYFTKVVTPYYICYN